MIARLLLTGAVFTAIFAYAHPARLLADTIAVPAPMMLGRWVAAPTDAPPTADELKRLCTNPAAYLQITPPTILKVTPSTQVSCDMPAWTKVGPTRFEARLGRCTPALAAADSQIVVDIKGMAHMRYNGISYAMCPTGP